MCNEINDSNVIEMQRDIGLLLSLDTYQGMTDAEIQSIIDYYSDYSARQALTSLQSETIARMEAENSTKMDALISDSRASFAKVLSRKGRWIVPEDDE